MIKFGVDHLYGLFWCLKLPSLKPILELPACRRSSGQRHTQALCLALFTLAIAAGNKGFLASGSWLKAYKDELVVLFQPPKSRLPSYSTIHRVLLRLDYRQYSACLARFFDIEPLPGETIAADGKVLRGSYQIESDNPYSTPIQQLCWSVHTL